MRDTVAAIWRQESAHIVAHVARLVRDLDRAEELAQDALLAALETWPRDGLPDKPAAWLMTTAKHRALDHLRRVAMQARQEEALTQDLQTLQADVEPDFAPELIRSLDQAADAAHIDDDLLRLLFIACHPVLPPASRVALTLRLLGGLSTAEIARACLQPEATVAQRIVRAKRTLADSGLPFELPQGAARREALGSVLAVVYLMFNEGHAASTGEDWLRPALCEEALRLARVLAGLSPLEPEVQGLLALLEIQSSRLAARGDAQGRPVLLMAQDRRRWDALLIRRGLAALARAQTLAQADPAGPGPYQLQAAIAACHARAATAEATDWPAIVAAYDALVARFPSPVVSLNRAVAVSMMSAEQGGGPAVALTLLQPLREQPALRDYPWLASVEGDVLARLGRGREAREAFERAARLSGNAQDQALLRARAAELPAD
ncbi:RNA polymerase sigma factor [Paucibacter sp. DJ2R-2]|uniref:RNA polymerase sigma factor n=1 Tax=Paucibacter sp. DJ2R-2 TaxID=2893558 RepID=UPI0021E4EE96|nr:sigma-70 family RNA polymerase sigma factor [Paucibacter sp. DJ2R-2]MCV2419181.1 sigma-70 family RNA polymerase sigma factor [Paucibacter sp. DJ4R-1]MCV2437864.1 sigma-70 family RNA polymerase sigma factor [Paucibacter sp. DJ2R-2]